MKQTVLAALALALLPSVAFSQVETGKDDASIVQAGRHVLDTGELAADFPCAPGAAEQGPTTGQAGLKCEHEGLTYFLSTAPVEASEEDGRSFGSYEDNLEGARGDADTARLVEGDYKGLRVFDAWKSSTGPVGRVRLIELSSSVMGMALVLETGEDEIERGGAEREAAFEQAEQFIASVEVLSK